MSDKLLCILKTQYQIDRALGEDSVTTVRETLTRTQLNTLVCYLTGWREVNLTHNAAAVFLYDLLRETYDAQY